MGTTVVQSTGNPVTLPGTITPSVVLWDVDFRTVAPGVWIGDGGVLNRGGKDMFARNWGNSNGMNINATDGLAISVKNMVAVYSPDGGLSGMLAPYVEVAFPELNFNVGPVRTRVYYDMRGATADFQFFFASWQWEAYGMFDAMLVGHNTAIAPAAPVHLGQMVETNSPGGALNTTNIVDPAGGLGTSEMRMSDFDNFDGRFGPAPVGAAWPVIPSPEFWFESLKRSQVRAGPSTIVKDPALSSSFSPLKLNLAAQATGTGWTAKVRRVQVEQFVVFNPA